MAIRCPQCSSPSLREDYYGYKCKKCDCKFEYDGYKLKIIEDGIKNE